MTFVSLCPQNFQLLGSAINWDYESMDTDPDPKEILYLRIRNTYTKEEMLLLTIHNTSREQIKRAKRLSLSNWGLLGLPVVLGLPSRNKEYILHLLLYRKKKLESGNRS